MIRAISNVTFVALVLALWVCSMESARGAIWVDSLTGVDADPVSGQVNSGTASSAPLKTIGAALQRVKGNPYPSGSSETLIYVRGGGFDRIYNEAIDLPAAWGTATGTKDGTAQNPIRFIGWVGTTFPVAGTIPTGNVPNSLSAAQGRFNNFSVQPVLFGGVFGNANAIRKPRGINVGTKKFIEFYNFDVCFFESSGVAVESSGATDNEATNNRFKSLFVYEIGRDNLAENPDAPVGTGVGVFLYKRTANTVENCTVLNCRNAGICIQYCNGLNTVSNCRVYNDVQEYFSNGTKNDFSGTDYYYHVIESTGNVLNQCWAERAAGAFHAGHAFVLQALDEPTTPRDQCQGNSITYCNSQNIGDPALLRGLVSGNAITALMSGNIRDTVQHNYGAIRLESGPTGNVFEHCRLYNSKTAIMVAQNSERTGRNAIGNYFRNCLFETSLAAIQGHPTGGSDKLAFGLNNSYMIACTFKGILDPATGTNTSSFFYMDRPAASNELVNCMIMDYTNYRSMGPYTAGTQTPFLSANGQTNGFTLQKCRIFNVGFPYNSESFVSTQVLGSQCLIADPSYQPGYYFNSTSPLYNSGLQPTAPYPKSAPHPHIGISISLALP